MVSGESDRLCQVLINLISNAVKYNTADMPVVELRSSLQAGIYTVEVEDNGAGIPREDRNLIFEKFARGQHAGGEAGAGLGLAISRQIIARMDGTLELVPGAGTGACFRVRLPLAAG